MHPGAGAGRGTAHRLPAPLCPQLGTRTGRGARGGPRAEAGPRRQPARSRISVRGTCTVAMTPHAPARGSQVPPRLPKPLLPLTPAAPRTLPSSIRGRTPLGKPQPRLPKPLTSPTPHPTGHRAAPGRTPPHLRAQKPQILAPTPRGQPAPRPLSRQPPVPPAGRQLPHYHSAQSLPNNRRIVAGGSERPPAGSRSGTERRHRARPRAPACTRELHPEPRAAARCRPRGTEGREGRDARPSSHALDPLPAPQSSTTATLQATKRGAEPLGAAPTHAPRGIASAGAAPSPTPTLPPAAAQHHAGQGAGPALPAQLCPRTACPWEAPEGQEGWGWPRSPRTATPGLPRALGARPARSSPKCRCSPRSPEPSSEAQRCTAETWEEPGVAFSLLSARFHGEHTLYSECHHFPWIVGQQERK